MSDFQHNSESHFEGWLYTGSGPDVEVNENGRDDDPSNDNVVVPSKGNYQGARAKLTGFQLLERGSRGN